MAHSHKRKRTYTENLKCFVHKDCAHTTGQLKTHPQTESSKQTEAIFLSLCCVSLQHIAFVVLQFSNKYAKAHFLPISDGKYYIRCLAKAAWTKGNFKTHHTKPSE